MQFVKGAEINVRFQMKNNTSNTLEGAIRGRIEEFPDSHIIFNPTHSILGPIPAGQTISTPTIQINNPGDSYLKIYTKNIIARGVYTLTLELFERFDRSDPTNYPIGINLLDTKSVQFEVI